MPITFPSIFTTLVFKLHQLYNADMNHVEGAGPQIKCVSRVYARVYPSLASTRAFPPPGSWALSEKSPVSMGQCPLLRNKCLLCGAEGGWLLGCFQITYDGPSVHRSVSLVLVTNLCQCGIFSWVLSSSEFLFLPVIWDLWRLSEWRQTFAESRHRHKEVRAVAERAVLILLRLL